MCVRRRTDNACTPPNAPRRILNCRCPTFSLAATCCTRRQRNWRPSEGSVPAKTEHYSGCVSMPRGGRRHSSGFVFLTKVPIVRQMITEGDRSDPCEPNRHYDGVRLRLAAEAPARGMQVCDGVHQIVIPPGLRQHRRLADRQATNVTLGTVGRGAEQNPMVRSNWG